MLIKVSKMSFMIIDSFRKITNTIGRLLRETRYVCMKLCRQHFEYIPIKKDNFLRFLKKIHIIVSSSVSLEALQLTKIRL